MAGFDADAFGARRAGFDAGLGGGVAGVDADAFVAVAGAGFDVGALAAVGLEAGAFAAVAEAGFDSAVFAVARPAPAWWASTRRLGGRGRAGLRLRGRLAAAGFGRGRLLAAVPAFGFAAVAGEAAAGLDAVPAFGFAAFGFAAVAVADFGASFAPAFGVGLRAVVPAARVRSVRVVLEAGVPVLVPPARGAGAGVSAVVSGSSP